MNDNEARIWETTMHTLLAMHGDVALATTGANDAVAAYRAAQGR